MKIAIIGSPKTYESERLVEAAQKAGHSAQKFEVREIMWKMETPPQFLLAGKNILDFDGFIFRGISRHQPQMMVLADYLLKNYKTIIDERLGSGRVIGSKLSTAYKLINAGVSTPKTYQALNRKDIASIARKLGYPLILKSPSGSKGKGVLKINNKLELNESIKILDKDYLIQEFIDSNFDIRVFVVGTHVLGAMKRTAPSDDFRSNIAVGGKGEKFVLTAELSQIALKAAQASGDDVVGVDVMVKNNQYYVIEVNRAPQFAGFEKATGIKVAEEIINYLENKKGEEGKDVLPKSSF